jgi:uncharacterized protein (TIGR02246 family)
VSNRRLSLLLLFAVLCLSSIVGCSAGTSDHRPRTFAQPADTRAADESAIRTASATWSQASTANDIDKSVSFYTEDAVLMDPNTPALKGRENIRKRWTQTTAVPGPGLSFQTTSVEVARSGDLAYETGMYDFVTTDKKGKTNDEKWKYVVVWKKQHDGSWKAAVDIDNPDQ